MESELSSRCQRLARRTRHWIAHNDLDAAESSLREAESLAADAPELVLLRGALLRLRGSAPAAVALLRDALGRHPDSAALHCEFGLSLRAAGDAQAAYAALRRACDLDPASAPCWMELGALLRDGAYPDRALDAFARARSLEPENVSALIAHADALRMLGRADEAAAEFRDALRLGPRSADAWYGLVNLKTVRLSDDELSRLQQLHDDPHTAQDDRMSLGFALAAALDERDRCAEAYAVVEKANALKRRRVEWNASGFSAQVDACMAAFGKPVAQSADATLGNEVIFVVSLPRSGSTLVEQILASHHEIEGAGEIPDLSTVIQEETARRGEDLTSWAAKANPDDWERMGRRYLELTRRWRRSKPVFVDKGLSNWTIVGAALAMLPAAHVVDVRRDPVETCWSCYRQLFHNASHFSYDIDELAAFYRDYERLMRFWRERAPERIHELRYESLIADPETEIRGLLEFCGLAFDPACLEFHRTERQVRTESAAQVRAPLRRDTARAGRYGEILDPLRRALGIAS